MKKIVSVFVSICLMLSLATPAFAAKTSGAASTLRLESTVGSVKLKNAAGRNLKISGGVRLYSGYKLSTQKASYAYISLDDTKAVKLDASTNSEVFQSGKKLELKVNSGQIFFNVSEPLKSDEALTIRTSTMVTGVRGTCGWVEAVNRNTTRISLLEGKLAVTSTDPVTQDQRTIIIVGGETATIVYHGEEKGQDPDNPVEDETIQDLIDSGVIKEEHIVASDTGLTVEKLQEEDVPGAVAVEVKKDPALQQRIEEDTELSVPVIIGDAESRLEEEETEAEKADEEIQAAVEDLGAEVTDPLFDEEETTDGDSGAVPEPAPALETTLDNPTTSELTAALNEGYEVINVINASLNNLDLSAAILNSDDAYIPANKTLNIQSGDVRINDNSIINVDGYLNIEGTATLDNSGHLVGNGTINFSESAVVENSGTIEINSTNSLHVNAGAELYNSGSITIGNTSAGAMTVDGEVQNSGTLIVQQGSTLNVGQNGMLSSAADGEANSFVINGDAVVNGGLTNSGAMSITENGSLTIASGGIMDNDAVGVVTVAELSVSGTFTVDAGGQFYNADNVLNYNQITNAGEFINNGNFSYNTEFITTGTFSGTGSITNDGGTFTVQGGTCTVPTFDNAYGTLTVGANGTMTVTGTYPLGPDPSQPLFNPTNFNIAGEFIIGENCVLGDFASNPSNSGTITNNSVNISPAAIGLTNVAGGKYVHTPEMSDLCMMVSDSRGKVTAWGTIPQPWLVDEPENSPFFDTDSQSETWLSGYTYTVYGDKTNSGYVEMPVVTADNVTLDLNGIAVVQANAVTVSGGNLTIKDSGSTGSLSIRDNSEDDYAIILDSLQTNALTITSGTVQNVIVQVAGNVTGNAPVNTITVNGGTVSDSIESLNNYTTNVTVTSGEVLGGISYGAGSGSVTVGENGTVSNNGTAISADSNVTLSVLVEGMVSGVNRGVYLGGNSTSSITVNGGMVTAASDGGTSAVYAIYAEGYATDAVSVVVNYGSTVTAVGNENIPAYAIGNNYGGDLYAPISVNGTQYRPADPNYEFDPKMSGITGNILFIPGYGV